MGAFQSAIGPATPADNTGPTLTLQTSTPHHLRLVSVGAASPLKLTSPTTTVEMTDGRVLTFESYVQESVGRYMPARSTRKSKAPPPARANRCLCSRFSRLSSRVLRPPHVRRAASQSPRAPQPAPSTLLLLQPNHLRLALANPQPCCHPPPLRSRLPPPRLRLQAVSPKPARIITCQWLCPSTSRIQS